MPTCWDQVVRASGDLWPRLLECRLGLSRAAAARLLKLASGDALDRHLRSRGLPPFRVLRDWTYVVLLVEQDAEGTALWRWVLRQGGDPAMYYRFVRRVTGESWQEVKARGAGWTRAEACRMWGPYLAPSLPPSLPPCP